MFPDFRSAREQDSIAPHSRESGRPARRGLRSAHVHARAIQDRGCRRSARADAGASVRGSRHARQRGFDRHASADRAQGRDGEPARPHRMPCGAAQSAVENIRVRGGCVDDLPGTGGLHPAGLVSLEGRARQGGAHVELCCRARLWAVARDERQGVVARACGRTQRSAGGALYCSAGRWRMRLRVIST